ncbi:hypothetical protein [uncultured Mediterranean phage uvMED]|nr:hypothetical protein [uncultured Mediterranean phage uvMED]BAQ91703.1 hypothetical protein [uncultured Mediterranean phage uvMED]BAQ91723.1 LPXTG-motif cell wall anchor domain containing protein [uncultured Mediterranean phage uvMED]BAQ91770.1 hypothetical protein [uncultured Mediterranean phage uvMED]BAR20504.1 hypothetical protein [uncultured Mediterranean phage uvMED]
MGGKLMENLRRNSKDRNKYYLNGWENCSLKKNRITKFWEVWRYTSPVFENGKLIEDSKYDLIATSMVLQGLDFKLNRLKGAN